MDRKVTEKVLANLAGKTVLEFGCGTGKNTGYLAREAKSVLAMDFSEGMLKRARRNINAENVSFIQHDIRGSWPFKGERFDWVIGNLILEHIENLTPIFAEAYRVLKPRGFLFTCELHPYRQIKGVQAKFYPGKQDDEEKIAAYIHDVSEYISAGLAAGFGLDKIAEWRDRPDSPLEELPRLISIVFQKPGKYKIKNFS